MKPKIEIIYQNDDIVVINKPTGLSVTKDRSGADDLLPILKTQLDTDLRLVHRLDKATSGAMLLAKNLPTQSTLSSMFEKQLIKKTYLAIVTGALTAESGRINLSIDRSKKDPKLMRISAKKGKSARTEWQLLADFGLAALLKVNPITGRTHQIRVHLKAIHLPLAIDPLYGQSRPLLLSDFKPDYRIKGKPKELPLMTRLTLHCYQLDLPAHGNTPAATFIAPLDKKFKAAIKMLTKHNPEGQNAFKIPDNLTKILSTEKLD